jgi:RimJ/RimL family protein N-acetyltransferase
VRLVSRWVLADRGMERLQLRADEQNPASRKVAENAGFTLEGILRSSRYNPRLGRRIDFVMYSLLADELQESDLPVRP